MNVLNGPARVMTAMAWKLTVLLCALAFVGAVTALLILGLGIVTGIAKYAVQTLLVVCLIMFILGGFMCLRWIAILRRDRISAEVMPDGVTRTPPSNAEVLMTRSKTNAVLIGGLLSASLMLAACDGENREPPEKSGEKTDQASKRAIAAAGTQPDITISRLRYGPAHPTGSSTHRRAASR